MVAPSDPRIASGSGWASLEFQRTSFKSVLINGTVAVASAVVLVCVAFAIVFDTVVPDAAGDVGAAEHTARKRTETTQKGTVIIVAWGDITTIECAQAFLFIPKAMSIYQRSYGVTLTLDAVQTGTFSVGGPHCKQNPFPGSGIRVRQIEEPPLLRKRTFSRLPLVSIVYSSQMKSHILTFELDSLHAKEGLSCMCSDTLSL